MHRRAFITKNFMLAGVLIHTPIHELFGKTSKQIGFDRSMVPNPIIADEPDFIDLYYKAWELAYDHIRTQEGLPQSPYMDEAFDPNTIWIWDTCFMVQFCKYAPNVFPGVESLKNFYVPIHDEKGIPLRIEIPDNPPLFAWTEYEYLKFTDDREHLKDLVLNKRYLQKHYEWFDQMNLGEIIAHSAPTCLKKVENGYLWEGGRSGMDNTPRGRKGEKADKNRPNNPDMLWIDAIAQQGLSALYISRMYDTLGDNKNSKIWANKYQALKDKVNKLYWDESDGFYYDIHQKTLDPIKVITPASFWPMLAEMCTPEQAARLVEKVKDKNLLGGKVPWVSLARNDADFKENGFYWRGSVWLPLAYMGIKALQKYNYFDLAYQNSLDIITHMSNTYKQYEPHTIWECYQPNEPKPAVNEYAKNEPVRKDFCGWSALGPISLLIENVLGFYDVNADKKIVRWHKKRQDKHGIKNLKFGDIVTDIIYTKNEIEVTSNAPYLLIVNGKKIAIKKGYQVLRDF